ncbi:MAG: hypothetical protein ABIT76_09660 [Chthoniobacterales bacterium]
MSKFKHSQFKKSSGVALIIILAFIVLLTGLIVAYFSRSMTDRQLSNSSFNQTKVEAFAKSATDIIVGDLKQEIVNGSTATTIGNVTTYSPTVVANILPMRSGNPPLASGVDPIPNLIRISSATATMPAPGVSSHASAVNSATNPSVNGRSVSPARWNSHYLIPRVAGATPTQTTPVTVFTAPDWVFVTTKGPQVITAPTPSVVGRYAYAIYDEGGLLDVNVAGYPSPSSVGQYGGKGVLSYADLTKVGLSPGAVDDLIGWRNYATMQTTGSFASFTALTPANALNYFKAVTTDATGFTRASTNVWNNRTDQKFLSRQELLNYRISTQFSATALQYLGTFSRELNAPSWKPTTPVGSTIDYAADADKPASINRNLLGIRFSASGVITSYHNDGSLYTYNVAAGTPFISRRFPLGRLNWIGPSGPQNGGTAANIQACFGLLWNAPTGIWKYVGASGTSEQSTIKKISDIAAEATVREPNFFELLQAGILSGSLAMEANYSLGASPAIIIFNYNTIQEASQPLHIFRIGASIISQTQTSSYPIVIEFDQSGQPWQACGVANLPYLNMFHCLTGADSPTSLECYLMFGLWNPHQSPSGTAPSRPPIRLRVKGSITVANNYGRKTPGYARNPFSASPLPYSYVKTLDATVNLSTAAGVGVNGFTDPHALLPTDLSPTPGSSTSAGLTWAELPSIGGVRYAGYRIPDFILDPTDTQAAARVEEPSLFPLDPPLGPGPVFWGDLWFAVNTNVASPFNCWLEFQNPNGIWIPYNYHAGINNQAATWFAKGPGFNAGHIESAAGVFGIQPIEPPPGLPGGYYRKNFWETTDPRSLRFNYTQNQISFAAPESMNYLNSSLWSAATDSASQDKGRVGSQVVQKLFGTKWSPASLSRNNTPPPPSPPLVPANPGPLDNSASYAAYKDPDGVQRIADSGLYTVPPKTNNWAGDPYATSTTRVKDRPMILNRLFKNVAELGYVARDYPWRTLDLFSPATADAGLLDLFTVNDIDTKISAGRVNLNTRNAAVLSAVLSGAIKTDLPQATISAADSKTIADAIVANTVTKPLVNKASFVENFRSPSDADTRFTALPTLSISGTEDNQIKPQRESIIRALADVGQTRTWNLLIDVIAQAGRYPSGVTASSSLLPDKFVVEGERRFWLHVAIDRFTGEVIDQQLESVSE